MNGHLCDVRHFLLLMIDHVDVHVRVRQVVCRHGAIVVLKFHRVQ